MTYELAKSLKDVGFPQVLDVGTGFYENDGNTLFYIGNCDTSLSDSGCGCCATSYYPDVRVPTLSELIEACGEDFRMLLLHTQYRKSLLEPWEAVPNKKRVPSIKGCKGSTPEIAVANLWLALNEK
jgi:hypothetical protein